MAVGRLLNFAAGACNTMCQEMLDKHDLTLPQWVILSALWRRDGLLVSEIAEYTGTNAPASSRIVDRMVEKGLVSRQTTATDRRAVKVSLTEHGRSLDHLAGFYEDVNARLLEGLSEREKTTLFGLLERVEQNGRKWKQIEEAG